MPGGRIARNVVGFVRARLQEVRRAVLFIALLVRFFGGPFLRRLVRRPPAGPSTGIRIRRLIEGMGISFVKLGQFLAMRFDIIPPEICRELDRLFEDAPVLTERVIRTRVAQELGRPVEAMFQSFEPRPLAAASIAQVHRAVTTDGMTVAVKIQRPGIQEMFGADMRILRRIAQLADLFRVLGRIRLSELVAEFAAFTEREMNFLAEAGTAERVRNSPGTLTGVPRIRWDLTTPRILTMEFVDGVSLLAVCQRAEAAGAAGAEALLPGVDLHDVITRLARTCLHQMFVTGLFHGDPHPGNILVTREGQPFLLDFGIFGQLSTATRTHLAQFYEALALGNIEEAFHSYQYISSASEDTDRQLYRRELVESLQRWYDVTVSGHGTVQERHPLRYVTQIVGIMRRHAVRMPPDQLLFWRSLTTLASLALRLPVQFDLIATLRQFFTELRPGIGSRIRDVVLDPATVAAWATLATAGPGDTRRWLAVQTRPGAYLRMRWDDAPADRRRRRAEVRVAAMVAVGISVAVMLLALVGVRPL